MEFCRAPQVSLFVFVTYDDVYVGNDAGDALLLRPGRVREPADRRAVPAQPRLLGVHRQHDGQRRAELHPSPRHQEPRQRQLLS